MNSDKKNDKKNDKKKPMNIYQRIKEETLYAITRKGYIFSKEGYHSKVIKKIRSDLTVCAEIQETPAQKNKKNKKFVYAKGTPFKIYKESEDLFYVPKFYGLQEVSEKPDIVDIKRGLPININWNPEFKLREHQKEPVQKVIEAFNKKNGANGGILCLPCGFGKSMIALYLISRVKRKTLIIVNTCDLTRQWEEEIYKFFNKNVKVGFIKGGTLDIIDKDIVIAVINSIAMVDYPEGFFNSFDMVVADETHVYGSQCFSQAFAKLQVKYTLGLSATIHRNDGLEKLLYWYIGPILYQKLEHDTPQDVIVNVINYRIKSEYTVEVRNKMDNIDNSTMLTNISNNNERSDMIVKSINLILNKNPKYQILVIAHRTNHLNYIKEKLDELSISSGLFTGKTKEIDRKKTLTTSVILGIYQLTAQAFNLPTISVVFMVSQFKNNEVTNKFTQIMGRMIRKKHDFNPMVIDINDNFSIYKNQYYSRRKYYKKYNHFHINEIKINNLDEIDDKLKEIQYEISK